MSGPPNIAAQLRRGVWRTLACFALPAYQALVNPTDARMAWCPTGARGWGAEPESLWCRQL